MQIQNELVSHIFLTLTDVILRINSRCVVQPPCSVFSTADIILSVAGYVITDVTTDVYDSRVSRVAAVQITV